MADGATELSDKEAKILDCALDLLKEAGDAGLTMRKLAERAGMRLSNVQYYFKSRDDVLKAMATRYFEECAEEVRLLTQEAPGSTVRERARVLIQTGLRHGDELSDMCRIFRELWAISSRNAAIRDHMADYYRTFSSLIADFVLGETADRAGRDRLTSLLLPFFEGYSVTAASVPLTTECVGDVLTDLAISVASSSYEVSGMKAD
ncbi:MAG: TetR/AcrR family transcriptional regulator [Pseudomonadota bacterium]